MNNKEIFAIAQRMARELKAVGVIDNIPQSKQPIYDCIRPTLIKYIPNAASTNDKTKEGLDYCDLPDDDELRAQVRRFLANRLADNTLTASEIAQLKDIFNLTSQSDDLDISTIDYRSMCDDCPLNREHPDPE